MIDFHTHIFPEKIASKTLDFLESRCHTHPYTNGMASGLLASTREAGLEFSVVLPVVTKPSQFDSINRFAQKMQDPGKGLLSFGGIHPDNEDYKEKLRFIRDAGMKGIKLHPDYQGVMIDDIRYKRIISYATELGLIISVHAGFDPGYPECVHCPPRLARAVIREVQPDRLILAHMGGYRRWDEVEEYLVGEPVWFDTAVVLGEIPDDQFLRIVKNHGADRILFGTDSPWAGQKEFVRYLGDLPLTEKERERIFRLNALELLGLSAKTPREQPGQGTAQV